MAATATVKGGLFADVSPLVSVQGTNSLRRIAAMALGTKSLRALREKMLTLNGATAGSTALETNGRVEANAELGGKRTIESETLVNAATVAGDVTEINADILEMSGNTYDSTPVVNKDGSPLGEQR